MQFPHLRDTAFPNLPTVNVYEFENNFDYTRWTEKTRIKLCNVLWNSDYNDIVKFETDAARDLWFDSIEDFYAIELTTSARIVPEGFVKLPIPYDVMAKYNYLILDIPIITSNVNRVDYETANGVRRWYFFIDNIVYLAPNSTQVYVTPDIWTIYQNDIDFKYMLLERGHAPVAYSSTDLYLANPIANNRYLLAPDVNFDNAGINRSNTYVPFGNGQKWVCIASTCAPEQISILGEVYLDPNYNPFGVISYSDTSDRFGYQLEVQGLTVGNGFNYGNAFTPAKAGHSNNNRIANNLSVYAIAAEECYGNGTFFADVMALCPQFLNTVIGCFVVDDACILKGSVYQIAGHSVYRCIGTQRTLLTKQLTKQDFGYPSEYERFAKLYTSPYAQIEITDNDGTTYNINIEETSTLKVESVVSVAFPFINERVYIDGIGGVGSQSYSWVDLAGQLDTLQMSNSDWFKYCFDWNIPTFTLYMDGETAYQLGNFNRQIVQGVNNALVAYHNSVRSANTDYENVIDSSNAAWANAIGLATTNRDNSYRSADTAKQNTYNSAATAHQNAYNSAATAKDNAHRTADTVKQNANNTAATTKTNADNSALIVKTNTERTATTEKTNVGNAAQTAYDVVNATAFCQEQNLTLSNTLKTTLVSYENATASTLCSLGQQKASNAVGFANNLCIATTDATIRKSAAVSGFNNVSNFVTSTIGGASQSAVLGATIGTAIGSVAPGVGNVIGAGGGAVGGALIGAAGGAWSAFCNSASVAAQTDCAQTIADAQVNYNNYVTSASNTFVADMQQETNSLRSANNTREITTANSQQTNISATSRANALAQRDTANTNALNTYTAITTNAADTYTTATTNSTNAKNTADTNALNTQNASKTNATNTETTAKTNADNTQSVAKTNADNTCTTTRDNALNNYNTAYENADRTKSVAQFNAEYTREVAVLNAKEILENAADTQMAGILDARNSAPNPIGSYSGNPAADYMRTRGLQIKVKTQSDSAIRQTGDTFVRYGYAYNQMWDVANSGLTLMRHFTYWKAFEIWVDARNTSNNSVRDFIQRIFLRGVTVWNSPTEIGRVNVYDN